VYIVSAFHYCDISDIITLRDLFGLIVSDVSVPDHLAPMFLDYGEVEHHGRKQVVEQSCSPHGNQEADRGRG
jgi:hypothetical protein